MNKEMERRFVSVGELRAQGEAGQAPKIVGYAAMFNSLSDDLGGFRETIRPGAFAKTLGADVRALWNHNVDYPLGRTKNGTLQIWEDEVGLRFEVEPPDTQYARDLITSIRRGDVDQMSFGFNVVKDDWQQLEEQIIRTLIEVELWDVSPVTFPAYPQTSAQVRGKVEEIATHAKEQHARNDTVLTASAGDGQAPDPEAEEADHKKAEARVRNANRKRKITIQKLANRA